MPRWLVLVLVFLLATLWWLAHLGSASHAATTTAASAGAADTTCSVLQAPAGLDDALQTGQVGPAFRAGDATMTPLAGFSVSARVLSREEYHFGRESDYSPLDLALGWGPMSAPGLAERLSVTQGNRWFRYSWGREGPPMPPADIATHSANMHMVPADAAVARELDGVAAGQMVRIDGWLLRIDGDDGWHWQSSLSRVDTGEGACELVLVCRVRAR